MAEIRILLVDDEEFYLRVFSDMLASRPCRVFTARSGEEALGVLTRETVDVMFTDLIMEGMDGLALTERVRALYPWVDMVVITQRDDVRLAVRSMKMGVFEYLVKPVDRDELLLTLDRLLERRRLMDRQNKLLDESLEYLQAQTVYRRCLDILSTLDFENLCELILRHLSQAIGAQGGLLWLSGPDHRPGAAGTFHLAGYRGLVTPQDFPSTIVPAQPALQDSLAAGRPFFADPALVLELPRRSASEALFIPLQADERPIGLMLLLDKLRDDFSERDQNIAATIAQFSAIALKNSRRFQALERVGVRDPGSSAFNLSYFIDYAGKEIYKARRYGRAFSLVHLILDRFDFLREHLRAEVCRQIAAQLLASLGRVVRDSDVLARVADPEYYILLPETDAMGARSFIRRVQEACATDEYLSRMARDYGLVLTQGAATFPQDGQDFDGLLSACREEMSRARASVYRKLRLEDKGFWDAVGLLLGTADDYRLELPRASEAFRLGEAEDGSSAHRVVSEPLFDGIEEQVALQAVDVPERPALLYSLGVALGSEPRPLERILDRAERARGYLIGRRAGSDRPEAHPAVTRVYLEQEAVDRFRVVLVLAEHLSYACLGERGPAGELRCFHSCDRTLVEGLVGKLQAQYNFQRQFWP
jgi:diguanylate cyclase (GGDEF)-like protein